MRAITTLSIVTIALTLLGCDSSTRDQISQQGGKALETGSKAATAAWKTVTAETEKLTQYSSKGALEGAKSSLQSAYDSIQKIEAPGEIDLARLGMIKDQIAKVDAALTIQQLRARVDEAIKNAQAAGKTFEEKRESLREMDAKFRELDSQLTTAERSYKLAVERLQESAKLEDDLETKANKK